MCTLIQTPHIYTLILSQKDSQGIIFRVLSGYTISHFRVLNRVIPVNLLLFSPFDHIMFADFVRLRWNAWKRKLMYCFYCFEYGNAWSSLEQGKKLQHFLLDRVAKFTYFVSWTGSGFCWVGWTPVPKFLFSTPPGRTANHLLAIRFKSELKVPNYGPKTEKAIPISGICVHSNWLL